MNAIAFVLQGWLGMLVRPALLLQVLVIIVLALATRSLTRMRPFRRGWRPLIVRLGSLGSLALARQGFMSLGMASGLIALAAALVLVSLLLESLRLLLRRTLPMPAIEQFWRLAVRPLFSLLVVLLLIERLDGLDQISQVSLINLFGNDLSVGELTLLVVLPYFLVVWSVLPVALAGWLGALAPSLAQIQFGTSLRCAAYALRFDRGVGTLRQGVIDAGVVALRSAGTVDLGAETIAVRSQLGPLGFRTTGSLADPQHRLDATGTARGVAEGATGIARGVLGALGHDSSGDRSGCDSGAGADTPGGASPASPVPSAPPGPSGLPGVLRDLFGR